MFLITEWFGAFLLDEKGEVRDERLFPKDARGLAAVLKRLQDGALLEEERALAVRADGELFVRESRHQALTGAHLAEKTPTLADQADAHGYSKRLLHEATVELGRLMVREASGRRDMHVVQAVDAIDELTEQSNILVERLREWYGLHFPEFVDAQNRNEEVAALVSAHGSRDEIMKTAPQYRVDDSMGGPLPPLEHEALRSFARVASSLYSTKADLEKYLDVAMVEIAPNVATLLQPVLAARMIRQAGGLRRLATMPAGTIQTLGAEKALFRHIKEGKRPPKHGFLMQHPLIHRAPRNQRGALARSLAAKVALAARADAFTHTKDLGTKLAGDFEKRADVVRDRARNMRKGPPRDRAPRGAGGGGFRRDGPPQRGPPRGPPRRGGEWR